MKKKILASIITLSLILTMIPANAFATNINSEAQPFESNICLVQGDSTDIFNGNVSDITLDYSYNIGSIDANGFCQSSLTVSIPTQDGMKAVTVEGELEETEDEDGNSFLVGPLEGQILIGSKLYDVTVGLTKDLRNNKVNAGVTMTTDTMNDEVEEAIMFSFGDKIELTEIAEPIVKETNGIEPYSYSTLASATVKLKELSTVTAMSMTGKYENSTKRAKNQVKSKISTLKNHFKEHNGTAGTVRIHNLEIGLKRLGNSPKTHIVGVEKLNINTGTGTVLLKSVLLDMLSLAGIPTGTIDAMLGNSKGSVTKDVNSNDTSVRIKFGAGSTANFDSTAFPVIFQLARNSGQNSAVSDNYKFYADITYYVHINVPLSGTTTYYLHSNPASATSSITV